MSTTSRDHVQAPLRDAWSSFKRDVVPASASATQRQEMRRAFYGGAQSMMVMLQILQDMPADARAQITLLLKGELATFVATVGTSLEERM